MIKFSANLTMLFPENDFPDRFEQAALAGFEAVEFSYPYPWPREELAGLLKRYRLEQVLLNLPPGNVAAGEKGIACLPGREAEFRKGVAMAMGYARALGCRRLNCLAGIPSPLESPENTRRTLIDNLRHAATEMEKEGIRLLVEPLNSQDVPGFYLSSSRGALAVMDEVDHPNIRLQYDVYHMQIMEGNLMRTIRASLARIGHIQIADNPGRHEPGTGEINYPNLFRFLEEQGYEDWVGCEYRPLTTTAEGLGWIRPYLATEPSVKNT
jgi:hydroxypyruvate isomerase